MSAWEGPSPGFRADSPGGKLKKRLSFVKSLEQRDRLSDQLLFSFFSVRRPFNFVSAFVVFATGRQIVAAYAVGVAAVRLDKQGKPEAIAAGGLKSFKSDKMSIELPERIDVALWRDASGKWRGVLQGYQGPVPETLAKITDEWTRLCVAEVLGVE